MPRKDALRTLSEGLLFLLFSTDSRHGQLCRVHVLPPLRLCPNPVGYQNKDVARLLSNQICTFEKVGAEGSDITEFVPVDENGDKLSGGLTVQFYNEFGKQQEEYTWWLGEDVDDGMPDAWYDINMDEPKARPLDFGEGFKSYTSQTGASLMYSGEVDTGAVAIPVPRLLSSKGNVRPCAIKMSDIHPVDESDEALSGVLTIQFYNEFGKQQEEYTWWLGEDVDDGMPDAWYDINMDEPKDKDLEAGQGFCLYTSATGVYLKFNAIGGK